MKKNKNSFFNNNLIVWLSIITSFLMFVLLVFNIALPFLKEKFSKKKELGTFVASGEISKKGIGGPATKETLNELNVSWFYNWGGNPGFKSNSGIDNWDPELWKKFIPLFYSKSYASTANTMNNICNKTNYCNGGYYLIGNEPLINDQDFDSTCISPNTPQGELCMAKKLAERIGLIAKEIKNKDANANLIIVGFSSPTKKDFAEKFIVEWKKRWQGTNIASLPDLIKGWHLHTYSNYMECPTNDENIRQLKNRIDTVMNREFGKVVPNQELWVTEMGSLDAPNPNTQAGEFSKFKNRMRCLVNVYENSDIVNRYAWFYHGCDKNKVSYTGCDGIDFNAYNLYWSDGRPYTISDLGKVYASLPSGNVNTPPSTVSNKQSLTCINPKCQYGPSQCNSKVSAEDKKLGGSCRIDTSCPGYVAGKTEWVWSYCYGGASPTLKVTPSPIPTNSSVPISIVSQSNRNQTCINPKCQYGPSQCNSKVSAEDKKLGGNCRIDTSCKGYVAGKTEWVWSYCY